MELIVPLLLLICFYFSMREPSTGLLTLSIQTSRYHQNLLISIISTFNRWFTAYIPLNVSLTEQMVVMLKQHSETCAYLLIIIQFPQKYMINGMILILYFSRSFISDAPRCPSHCVYLSHYLSYLIRFA